jgi:nucleotide-binding universal stress UspA family protein
LILGSVADKIIRGSRVPVIVIGNSCQDAESIDLPDKKILVLLDGSNLGEQVLPAAIEYALRSDREMVLLHVHEPPDVETPASYHLIPESYPPAKPLKWDEYAEEEMARLNQKAKDYLTGVEKRVKDSGVDVISETIVGEPADEIVSYLSKNSFNLVAMSTHGRSGLSRIAFGSVADKVLRTISYPVMLMRPVDEGQKE